MNLMAYNLSTFGSRFSLIFDQHNKRVKHAALGMFIEHTSELFCGVKVQTTKTAFCRFAMPKIILGHFTWKQPKTRLSTQA